MNTVAKESFNKIKEVKAKLRDDKNNVKLQEELLNINKELKENALKMFSDESAIKKFLDNIGVFNNYTYNNQLLILFQKPDYSFVASFDTYKKLGYSVKRNPDSITIVRPVMLTTVLDNRTNELRYYSDLNKEEKEIYKNRNDDRIVYHSKKLVSFALGTVFDITDSTMPYEEIKDKLYPKVTDENADYYIDAVEKVIKDNHFNLEYNPLQGKEGYCTFKENKIVISDKLTGVAKLKVLLHELAHSLAHTNLKDNYADYKKDRGRYEVEAEAISYSVGKFLNINMADDSLAYLYSYSKNKDFEELDNSLKTIVEISSNIIKKINDKTKNFQFDYNIDNEMVK